MDWGFVFENALRAAFGPEAAVFALAAVGLNVHYGYTGLLNFGQIGFLLVGGFGLAVTAGTFGWPLWAAILAGLFASFVLAVLLGIPTLRLRGDYFAITTIATAEILRLLVASGALARWTGGVQGIQGFAPGFYEINPFDGDRYGIGALSYPRTLFWGLLVTWVLVVVVTILVAALIRSPWGRVLRSVREDEDAVRSLGKNAVGYKMQSLILGGVIGGLAGIMFVLIGQSAHPTTFRADITFFFYALLILGGAATRLGPIVGAWIFFFITEGIEAFLREAQQTDALPDILRGGEIVAATSTAVVGLGLILLLAFRPQGIFGKRREMVLDVR